MFTWLAVDPVDGALEPRVSRPARRSTGTMTGVTLARSVDGGKTFVNYPLSQPPFDCCAASSFFGDYNGIDAYGGRVVAVFPVLTTAPAGEQSCARRSQNFDQVRRSCNDVGTWLHAV